jgi:excisionase family DNA binding protein
MSEGILSGEGLIASKDIAKYLKVSSKHVRRLCYRGDMPKPYRLGHLLRWEKSEIREWLSRAKMTEGESLPCRNPNGRLGKEGDK